MVQTARKGNRVIPDVEPSDFACVASKVGDAVDSLLGHNQRKKVRIELTLSDSFAKVAMLPWQASLTDDEEIEAYARLCLEPFLDDVRGDWKVYSHRPVYGAQGLAIAMPASRLQAIDLAFRQDDLQVAQVRPTFCRLIDWAKSKTTAELLQIDGQFVSFLRTSAGGLDYLELDVGANNLGGAISRVAARGRASSSSTDKSIHIWNPEGADGLSAVITSAFGSVTQSMLSADEVL